MTSIYYTDLEFTMNMQKKWVRFPSTFILKEQASTGNNLKTKKIIKNQF